MRQHLIGKLAGAPSGTRRIERDRAVIPSGFGQRGSSGRRTKAQMRIFATYRAVCEDPRHISVVPAAV